ncbi:hypothetical protein WJX73_010268 [Symbiochloris irregularis]|uniref:Aquaporin n=1 Tax=Symbiochloris irregularis TaxID=706552 RepID=A0AAW1PMD4_9CHLO
MADLFGAVLGDGIATAAFVFISSVWDELGEALSDTGIPPLAAGLAVVVAGLAVFEPIGQRLGGHGASWNPATSACFAAAGKGGAFQHTIRTVGQTLGAVGGSAAAFYLVPSSWQGKFKSLGGGLRPGVSLTAGLTCELLLGFLLHTIVMWSISMRNKKWGFLTPLIATIFLVLAGMELTGPSLNPAVTFAWAVHHRQHALREHLLVFWAGPILGGLLAGWVWRWGTAPTRSPSPKRKTRTPPKSKAAGKATRSSSAVRLAVHAGNGSSSKKSE